MKLKVFITLTLSLAGSPVLAFHADIFLVQQDGALLTGRGAADPGSGGEPQVGTRFHVNDIAGFVPFVDMNPGVSAAGAGESFFLSGEYQPLPGSRNLGFNVKAFRIQNGPAANLFYWDGSGEVAFEPVTNPHDHLEVRLGIGSAIATGAAEDVLGFDFTATSPLGVIHSHLTFDFDVDNNSGTAASTGIFLTALEFSMDLVGDATREMARPHYVAWFNGPPGALKSSAMAAANLFLTDHFADLRLFGDVSPRGEDELPDDLVNAADIDALLGAVNSGTTDLLFDLNNDTLVDSSDTETLFDLLGTQYGDANLDGLVNGDDLHIWQTNYGNAGGWSEGNFNGDGMVNGRDFLIWQRHFGFGMDSVIGIRAIPEPTSTTILLVGLIATVTSRSWQHRMYLATEITEVTEN